MATFSYSSDHDLPSWQTSSLNGENNLSSSLGLSESYTTESCTTVITTTTTNGSYPSQSLEEVFDSKLSVSDTQKTFGHQLEGEDKLNAALMAFRDKITFLEKQREILEDRWSMLKVDDDIKEADLEPVYLSYISRLLGQVNSVSKKNNQTQKNLLDLMDSLSDMKDKYEDELSVRTDLEYGFVQMKKDVDCCSLDKTELEVKQQELKEMIELLRAVYEHELNEVLEQAGDISVLVNIDNRCRLNLDKLVQEVKERYDSIAERSQEEAHNRSKKKLEQGVLQAGRCEVELENSRGQITQLTGKIQRLRSEILSVQTQCTHMDQQVALAKTNSDRALKDANAKLGEMQEALKNAKQEFARQMKDYQELLNLKLTLDIEIVTYKKLLEGEEKRLNSPAVVNIHRETELQKPSLSRNSSSSWSTRSNTSDVFL